LRTRRGHLLRFGSRRLNARHRFGEEARNEIALGADAAAGLNSPARRAYSAFDLWLAELDAYPEELKALGKVV
jgi:hypothetical protein